MQIANRLNSRWGAVLVICLTIVVSSAVSATAARMITSKQIKNNTITTSDIRNGTIRKADLSKNLSTAGPQGPAGAPGTARAYAQVNRGFVSFSASRTKGFLGVSRLGIGQYCLELDPATGVTPETALAVASAENGTSGVSNGSIEVWGGAYAPCGANGLHVRTYASNGASTDLISFVIIVA